MRSRFSAFALASVPRGPEEPDLAAYLLATWHASTRPADVELDPDMRWPRLDVLRTVRGGPFDTAGTVEFRAWWRTPDERGEMHEVSSFVREAGRWCYVDGIVD